MTVVRIERSALKARPKKGKTAPKTRRLTRKDKLQFIILGLLLLLTASGGAELSAMKRMVHIHGTVEQIDLNSQTLLLTVRNQPDPLAIKWRESTEFELDGTKVEPSALDHSMKVIVWKRASLFFPERAVKISATGRHLSDEKRKTPENEAAL